MPRLPALNFAAICPAVAAPSRSVAANCSGTGAQVLLRCREFWLQSRSFAAALRLISSAAGAKCRDAAAHKPQRALSTELPAAAAIDRAQLTLCGALAFSSVPRVQWR